MTDAPAVLIAGFEVWPGPSAWARRMTEGVRASANRHRVLTLSLRGPTLAHTESLFGARVLRVPPGPGTLLEQVEAFGRALHRQLDSDAHALVHTADPLVGAAVLDQALRRWERQCLDQADAVLVTTRTRAEEVEAAGRTSGVHLVPDGIETGTLLPRVPGPLRIRHVGWDLSSAGLRVLLEAFHALGRGARLHLVQPRSKPWDVALQREVTAAARGGGVTSGPPGALPGSWADVEILSGIGPDARAPAVLADALEPYARGRPVLAADSEAARADLPAGCTVFFPGADGEALGDALVALASTPELLEQSGEEARAYVERRHDAARVRGLLRDLYRAQGALWVASPAGGGASRPSLPAEWGGSPRLPGERAPEGTDPGTPPGGFG